MRFVLHDGVQMDQYWHRQEHISFEIDGVTIKIQVSMTEYHHWINDLVDHLLLTAVYGEKWIWYISGHLHILAFEVHFFRGSFLHLIKDADSM